MSRPSFHREQFTDVAEELEALIDEHEPTSDFLPQIQLWDRYAKLASASQLRVYVARLHGEVVAFALVVVARGVATREHVFAAPEQREDSTAAHLIEFAAAEVAREGLSL